MKTRRFLSLVVALFSWAEKDVSFVCSALSNETCYKAPKISQADLSKIANGGVAVLPNFVPQDLVERMRTDAKQLKAKGAFRPDGLSNYAKGDTNHPGMWPSWGITRHDYNLTTFWRNCEHSWRPT